MKAKDIMSSKVITISPDSGIGEAAKLISMKSVSGLVVVEDENPIAVISESDIVKGMISDKKKVKDVMDKDFLAVSPLTDFSDLSMHARQKKIKRFPVVDNKRLVGLVTEIDIIEATRDFTKAHTLVQDSILAAFGLATIFFLFYYSPLWKIIFG